MWFTFDIFVIFPELFLLVSSLIILIFGVLINSQYKKGFPLIDLTLGKLIFFLIGLVFCLIFNMPFISVSILYDFFLYDKFCVFIKLFLLFIFNSWVSLSLFYINQEKLNLFEYWVLALIALLAMFSIVCACDILILYLGIELQSLIFYILAGLKRTSEFSTEASLKYFILGAFSSILLLFGFSLIYAITGLTHFNDFNKIFFSSFHIYVDVFNLVSLGLLFILIAFLFKFSASPFHIWSIDVYEGSLTSVTSFFAFLPKIVIIAIILRLFFCSFQTFFLFWQKIFIFSIILSLIFGTFGALKQWKWKRFLAFSSILHIAFILMGLIVNTYVGNEVCFFYFIVYLITTANVFFIFVSIRQKNYINIHQIRFLSNLSMLSKVNPAITLSLLVCLFSMGGIPPFIGFLSKALIFFELIISNWIGLVIFSVLLSCLSCFYYLRIIKSLYFEEKSKWPIYLPINKHISFWCWVTIFILLYLGLDPVLIHILLKLFIIY
uniref:NADH dehydrogenase subunit 2 n=1 Tax=Pulvinaster venetus TaxID=427767 RepID=UPI001FCD45F7|nr:NADH dehydrogenase subunit 2 [Pulvinaster venetus]UNJ18976.1 NADH dehydrogenase subunit 2 [Pulvinaster venetus]